MKIGMTPQAVQKLYIQEMRDDIKRARPQDKATPAGMLSKPARAQDDPRVNSTGRDKAYPSNMLAKPPTAKEKMYGMSENDIKLAEMGMLMTVKLNQKIDKMMGEEPSMGISIKA